MEMYERVSETRFEGKIGAISKVSEGVIEIQSKQGVEYGRKEAEAVGQCIHALTGGEQVALLVDRRNAHTLTFEAQQIIGCAEELTAVAFIVDSPLSRSMIEYEKNTYLSHVPLQVFVERSRAVVWLEEKVAASKAS